MPEMHKLSPGVENTIDKLKQAFFAGDLNRISNLLDRLKQNSNNPFETAHYHYYKASYLTALGDLSSSELLKQVSELEALYHQLKSQKILAFLFIRKALIALHLCNFDLSKKYFLNALKTLEKLNLVETYEYAVTQINLGIIYFDQFLTEKAIDQFFSGFKVAVNINHLYTQKKALKFLFYSFLELQDVDSCLAVYNLIQNRFPRNDLMTIESEILYSHILSLNGFHSKARKNLLSAYLLAKRLKYQHSRFDIHYHLCLIFVRAQNKKWKALYKRNRNPIFKARILRTQMTTKEISSTQLYELDTLKKIYSLEGLEFVVPRENKKQVFYNSIDQSLQISGQKYSIKTKKVFSKIIEELLEKKILSKNQIMTNIFDIPVYDPIVHSGKIYKLIYDFNNYIGHSLIIASKQQYSFSQKYTVINLKEESSYYKKLIYFLCYYYRQSSKKELKNYVKKLSLNKKSYFTKIMNIMN